MKIIKLLPPLFLIFTCFCFAQCKKHIHTPTPDNPYGLPNATQTGAGVFACRINGVNAIAKNDINSVGGWMSKNRDTLSVGGIFRKVFFQQIAFGSLDKDREVKNVYPIEDSTTMYFLFSTDSTCRGGGANVINIHQATGTVVFTKIDTVKTIVSGTFSCRIPIPDCDTLNVTDGRFDITYHF